MIKLVRTRAAVAAALACLCLQAVAQTATFDIAAQPLKDALAQFAQQSGVQIVFAPEVAEGRRGAALKGTLEAESALEALLAGSGLRWRKAGNTYTVELAEAPRVMQLPAVLVRGTAEASTVAAKPYAGGQVARGAALGMLGTLDMMETPFSVTAYTGELARNQQARTLADVLVNDASVRTFNAASFPQDSFYVRGFQLDSGDIGFGGLYGVMPLLRMSPSMADRIEVFKGPGAMFNGVPPFGSIGGNINIVPKRAGKSPVTELTLTHAGRSQEGVEATVQRRFGAQQQVGFTFTGNYRDGETALEGHDQQYGQGVFGLDYQGAGVRLSADFGAQQQRECGIENGIFGVVPATVPDAPDADRRMFQPWLYHHNRDRFAVLRGEVDLGRNFTAFAAVGARRHRYEELYAYGFPLQANGDFEENFGYGTATSDTNTAHGGLRSRFSTREVLHDVTITATALKVERRVLYRFGAAEGGVDNIVSNIYSPVVAPAPSLAPLPGDLPLASLTRLQSLAFADVIQTGDERLSVIVGARLQRIKIEPYDERALTPSLGAVFKVRPDVALYANYIEGLSQGPTPPASAANNTEVFEPVRTKQIEVGGKVDLRSIAFTAALFQIAKPNGVTDPGTNVFSVDGEQRNRGLELNVFGEPTPGVRVMAGTMFLDGKLTRTEGGINDGKRAADAPRRSLNLNGEWDLSGLPGLTLTGRVVHTSSIYIDAANTQEIPAWTRLDLGARYAFSAGGLPVTLRVNVENVANRSYWSSSSLYRGAPRTLLVSGTVAF